VAAEIGYDGGCSPVTDKSISTTIFETSDRCMSTVSGVDAGIVINRQGNDLPTWTCQAGKGKTLPRECPCTDGVGLA